MIRTPLSVSPNRPVTSALILPRSRNRGRSFENAMAMTSPNRTRTINVTVVSRQFR